MQIIFMCIQNVEEGFGNSELDKIDLSMFYNVEFPEPKSAPLSFMLERLKPSGRFSY